MTSDVSWPGGAMSQSATYVEVSENVLVVLG